LLLARFLLPYTKKIILLCILALLYAFVSLATPLVYRTIFDELLPNYTEGLLLGLCLIIALICVLSITLNALTYKLLVAVRVDFSHDLRLAAMDGFLDYPYSFYQKSPSSRLVALVGADMEKLAELVWNLLRLVISGVQLVIMLGFVCLFLEIRICVLFLGVIVLYFFWSLRFRKLSLTYGKESLQLRDDIYKHCYDIFPKIREIKCFGLYKTRLRRLKNLNERERRLAAKATVFESLLALGASLPVRLCMVVIFIFGYLGITAGSYTPGYIMIILIYTGTIIYPIVTFFNSFADCYFFWHIRDEVRPFLGLKREQNDGITVTGLQQGIIVRGLDFSYPPSGPNGNGRRKRQSRPPVLHGVTLTVPTGGFCTLVGASGAGKTTFISLLVRLYDAPRGSIYIDGRDICDIHPAGLRRLIGVVTQEPYILNDTLRANIDPDGELGDTRILEICTRVSLDTLLGQLPLGLDTVLLEGGQNLSGGERQRVVLARRLARGNRIIILDEATSALDEATEKEIINTIIRLRKQSGITFIGISHRLEPARLSDMIYVFEHGRVAEQGTHDELLAYNSRYHELFRKSREYNNPLHKHSARISGGGR
jgi:ATP-binding cassette, subfamily B, bacterial